MTWIVFARAPAPDAPYWPGRRLLAVVDAVAWPAVVVWLIAVAPWKSGLLLPVAAGFCAVNALARAHTALVANHRYRFTTWRGARVILVLMLIGLALKLALGTH